MDVPAAASPQDQSANKNKDNAQEKPLPKSDETAAPVHRG
jgi:hypothetical protein